jgi:hypothetical protein
VDQVPLSDFGGGRTGWGTRTTGWSHTYRSYGSTHRRVETHSASVCVPVCRRCKAHVKDYDRTCTRILGRGCLLSGLTLAAWFGLVQYTCGDGPFESVWFWLLSGTIIPLIWTWVLNACILAEPLTDGHHSARTNFGFILGGAEVTIFHPLYAVLFARLNPAVAAATAKEVERRSTNHAPPLTPLVSKHDLPGQIPDRHALKTLANYAAVWFVTAVVGVLSALAVCMLVAGLSGSLK